MSGNAAVEEDSAEAYLDDAVESVNKSIDTDIKAMMDAFDALIRLASIKDKDTFRIAQERFEAEARADVMTPLGETTDEDEAPLDRNLLNEEAKQLIRSTTAAKKRCAEAVRQICGLERGQTPGEGLQERGTAMEIG